MLHTEIIKKAAKIKLLVLDVDGVLTDGKIWLTNDNEEYKSFHTQDGLGLKRLQKSEVTIAIISGRSSKVVAMRMQELGIEHVHQGVRDKLPLFQQLLKKLNLTNEQTAYVGDDLPDLPIMQQVGLSIAVANATDAIKQHASWITHKNGGEGAVREACELILAAKSN